MQRAFLVVGVGLVTIANAEPPLVTSPTFKAGDTWVYDQTDQQGTNGFGEQRVDLTVERADGPTMLVGIKRDGAPTAYEDHVVGADWSQRHVVDGQEAPTTRPLNFPMRVGQSWTVDYSDATRRGMQTGMHVHRTYQVAGWENVTVPAGTFHAIRIEGTGVSDGTVVVPNAVVGGAAASPSGGSTFTQSQRGGIATRSTRDHDIIYYVPAIKNWVKSVEERYNSDDVLVGRKTLVMVSYKPAA